MPDRNNNKKQNTQTSDTDAAFHLAHVLTTVNKQRRIRVTGRSYTSILPPHLSSNTRLDRYYDLHVVLSRVMLVFVG